LYHKSVKFSFLAQYMSKSTHTVYIRPVVLTDTLTSHKTPFGYGDTYAASMGSNI